jgi:hypothetical protein
MSPSVNAIQSAITATGHAMAYSTAVHPKGYWYVDKLHVAGLESPLPKSHNRCLIQYLITRASAYVDGRDRSIRTNIARENTRSGPTPVPRGERIFRTRRVKRAMLVLCSIASL